MTLETYTINNIVTVFCSVGFGTVVTLWATRKKIKAETNLFNTEIYSTMLGDLRAQINMQGEQIKNQAQQIQNLQEKETENIKVINLQQRRERHYLNEIKDLKATIKNLESKLESIQNQISNEQS
ncbi:hypothetical protein SAMN05421821_105122 [Mucilaginibacter lappiensis]|uniref:Ubiquinone biosynthesis protein UbiJ n=1 Tax=Mucilaginibacter lappiensis TaxID=354630 RepID=A0ABR6PIV9_9SPHI|nr:hypothetical protein [Mucilaginibacter lappiensis]MBB6109703.1 ubiquinone biosynthesis protein UbiJ [Mucilaginibacter lappiensis]SIR12438.1 hypothetical protein SAMN05421821_105122 [Mucilaginibacter lappiensis]